MKIVVATTNQHKVRELNELFKGMGIDLLYLKDFKNLKEVEETGLTFKENAILKAQGYAKQTGILTLGEDSGLSCDALEGAPGIYSARFAGEHRSDQDNNEKLMRLLKTLPDNCRDAHYTSAIALATAQQVITIVEGRVSGSIARESQGTEGFGYDPIFYHLPYKKTFGQVSQEMKQKVSHRAQAFKQLKAFLQNYLSQCAQQ